VPRGHRGLLGLRRNTTLGQPDTHIDKAANVLLQTSQRTFPVVDGNGSFVGTLDRANNFQSVKQAGPDARVADAMTASPVRTVGCRATLEQALRLMQQNSAATVAVTDAAGKLVGFVTSDTIGEMMTLAMLQKDRAGTACVAEPPKRHAVISRIYKRPAF
jgi:CBS-domain-containing membrane protein